MNRQRLFFAQLCVMILPLVASAANFDRFCDTFAAEWMRADPQAATALQYFSGAEQDALDRQLTPMTKEARAARVAAARRGLAELRNFDRGSLDTTQRISAAATAAKPLPVSDYSSFYPFQPR